MKRYVLRTLPALVLLGGLLSPVQAPVARAGHVEGRYFDLDVLPAPATTGAQMVDALETFVSDHPYRVTGTPTELKAAELLRGDMASLGYQARIEELPAVNGLPGAGPIKAVTGLKRGTTLPDEWILIVGHYDTIATTIWGAYDNGAGTNMMRFLARTLADVPTNRSIAFAFYNGEEEGLLASQRHATLVKGSGQKIAAVLGFDMVGIGFPVKSPNPAKTCMCLYHGQADGAWAQPLLAHVNFDFLGFPNSKSTVDIAGPNIRNSDERSFERQGYRVLRWTGMRRAGDYRAYHLPDDTMATIYDVAGGREFFEQGTLNTLRSAYYTALAIDNHPPEPQLTVSADGLTVTLDGAGTTDEDGAVGDLVWDLGDGTTATGGTATHTFAQAGTYLVRLTAHDNLWPAVTRSVTATITVS